MNRLFVLREPLHFDNMLAALRQNWPQMAAAGHPLGVTVAPYKRSRSQEQNALMWVWLTAMEQQAWVAGQQFDAETWHEHFKRELLPERNARGDEKWKVMPTGERLLVMSTTRLNTAEMSLYMEALSAAITTDFGVELP